MLVFNFLLSHCRKNLPDYSLYKASGLHRYVSEICNDQRANEISGKGKSPAYLFFLRGYQQRTGIAVMHLSFSKKILEKQFESAFF